MKFKIEFSNKFILHFLFVLWLFTEILLEYSLVSQICLVLFAGVAIIVSKRIHFSYYCVCYSLLVLWSVLNIQTGHAVSMTIARQMTSTIFINALFLIACYEYCVYIGDTLEILELYRRTLVAFSVICLVLGLPAILAGERLTVFGLNANGIAKVVAYASIIDIYALFFDTKKRGMHIFSLVLFFLVILLSGSRSGFIIPIIGTYILFCWNKPKRVIPYTIIAVVLLVGLYCLLIRIPMLYQSIGYRVEALLGMITGTDEGDASLRLRSYMINIGWISSQDSPIWGHGLDCFRTLPGTLDSYSHNNYIELLYSLGWIGVAIYYIPNIISIGRYMKAKQINPQYSLLMLALLIPQFFVDYSSVPYFTRRLLIVPLIVSYALNATGGLRYASDSKNNG